jgi:F1F0 ATPase subunit 2
MMPLGLAFLAGFSLGALHFAALWVSVRRLTAGGSVAGFALGALLRLGLAAAALAALFALGRPLSEIAAAGVGYLASRVAATRLGARSRKEL